LTNQRQLDLCDSLNVDFARADPSRILVEKNVSLLIDRTDRELRMAGRADLTHQHDIQLTTQGIGDDPPHWHRAARYRQYQWPRSCELRQPRRQLASGIVAITKWQRNHWGRLRITKSLLLQTTCCKISDVPSLNLRFVKADGDLA
jgi:hypothetical protein